MIHFSITISVVLSLLFANVEPVFAQSKCVRCNMDIASLNFLSRAQLSTGEIVEFDAIECLVNYIKTKQSEELEKLRVTDFTTGQIIEAQGDIKGSDPDLNPMMVTTADPDNYGGELIRSGFGLNAQAARNKVLIGLEVTTPVYRDYNGIQMDEKWGLNASLHYIAI